MLVHELNEEKVFFSFAGGGGGHQKVKCTARAGCCVVVEDEDSTRHLGQSYTTSETCKRFLWLLNMNSFEGRQAGTGEKEELLKTRCLTNFYSYTNNEL